MMIKQPRKITPHHNSPLFLLFLSVVLLSSLCITSVATYATSNINNYNDSVSTMDAKSNKIDDVFMIAENSAEIVAESSVKYKELPSICADNDQLIPEDPPVREGEAPSKIIVAELQDKTGVPEIYDDGIFRYYLVDGSYYEVAGIYKSCFDEIEIPSELFGVPVKGIQSCAFRQYKYLVSVVIPESIEYIGDYAFHNCPNLTTISLPKHDIQIGEGVFQMSE